MVDRRRVCAVAKIVREIKSWHDDGRMMHKKNTFTDFIASAEYEDGFRTDSGVYPHGDNAKQFAKWWSGA